MDRSELQYWVALARVPQIGRARIALLEAHFGRLEDAWKATPAALQGAGLTGSALSALLAARDGISPEGELEQLERQGVVAPPPPRRARPPTPKKTLPPPPPP